MERIKSFEVDHDFITPGFYISRIDGDVTTYDLRTRRPNCGDLMCHGTMHTFEHLFATYVRNSPYTDQIVYVGPMGCRTGFYFLTRELDHQIALDLFRETLGFIASFEGEIPGASESKECGNYLDHDLAGAKAIAEDMIPVLKDWTVPMMEYEYHQK
jgi:S-ribosylhomocysteine lyase